ncbi:TonB-dependent siderophore receptor [Xylophilus rhododendri]|uniref:TonB-dependent siderophore receptor n=1 Tax=Xylophilus rhododendri TaxID=2697032 RepID=A0A857J731_9BURK|nr:TonB-dependent siderophore receptor [Xylophilus rhododendri]QHI99646.1 TonB-dependent siderophore receptor [Xylophilus rhododendri]
MRNENHYNKRFGLSALSIAVLTALGANAQAQTLPAVNVQSDQEHGANYAPASSTTAAKIDAPLRDIPQSVQIVTQEVMRDQGARSVTDVMKTIPSVGLATGDGQRDALVIRGFTALYDILLDGVRDDAQYFRDLYNIERVEVIKGPAAALYGRGSSGGLVNLITKKPGFTNSGEIGYTTGSYGLKRADFNLNRAVSDTLALRLDGAVEDSGSYRPNAYIKSQSFSPSLLWKDGSQSLLLQYNYQNQERSIDFGVPGYKGRPADVSSNAYYGSLHAFPLDHANSRVESSTAQYKNRFGDGWAFTDTLRYYEYTLDRRHTRVGSVNDSGAVPMALVSRGSVQRFEHGWFNQSEITKDVTIGGLENKLLVGIEVGEQKRYQEINNAATNTAAINAGYAFSTPLFAPVPRDLPNAVPLANASGPTAGMTSNPTRSLYAQSLTTWSPTIKTMVGLRYDSFGQKYDDRLPANADLSRTDRNFSPRVGIVWQPNAVQSYYASVTKSYQPSGEAGPLATNNADLKPEQTVNLEIGSKTDLFDGAASFTAALYQLTRSDVKYTDPILNKLVNVGEQRSRGVELTLSGQVRPGWQVIAGYSYLDAEVTKGVGTITAPFSSAVPTPLQGKVLALAPKQTFSLWTLKSVDSWVHGVQVGAGLITRSSSYANVDNAVVMPGFATVDLAAYWRPTPKGWSASVNLKNAFDKHYYLSANNDVGILPAAPRTIEVSARYTF